MKAAVLHGKEDVRVEEIAPPKLQPGEVRLRIEAALTCGTDLKVFKRGYHARMIVPPAVFGHELAGVVSEVGIAVMPDSQRQADPASAGQENADYDLSRPLDTTSGLRQGLTSYGDPHFSLFLRKVFIKALGYSEDALSRPIIGIVDTYSAFNPCHANVPQLIDAVKRGVQLSGGLAMEFPTISLHESFASPTSMFLRNLMSMDTEEMIKAQPVDAVVLIGGGASMSLVQANPS